MNLNKFCREPTPQAVHFTNPTMLIFLANYGYYVILPETNNFFKIKALHAKKKFKEKVNLRKWSNSAAAENFLEKRHFILEKLTMKQNASKLSEWI